MTKKNKAIFGFFTILAITAISAFAVHYIQKTHENISDSNGDIDWDI